MTRLDWFRAALLLIAALLIGIGLPLLLTWAATPVDAQVIQPPWLTTRTPTPPPVPTPVPLPDLSVFVNDKPNAPHVGSRQTYEVIARNAVGAATARGVGANLIVPDAVEYDATRGVVPLTPGALCDVLPEVGGGRWMVACSCPDVEPGGDCRFYVHTVTGTAGTYSVNAGAAAMWGGVLADANPADNGAAKTFEVAP